MDALCEALAAQGALVTAALAPSDPVAPTRCAGWTVAHLDRHLGQVVASLTRLLPGEPGEADAGLSGWADALPGLAAALDEEAHQPGPGLAAVLPGLVDALQGADPDAVVSQWTGRHTVRDAALFRLVELVVHGRDLPEPVLPDGHALELVVVALVSALPAGLAVPPYVDGNGPAVEPLLLLDLCTGRVPVPPGLGTVGEAFPLLG
ncbi:MAG: hypothetical protein JWO60_1334 [Frankiales bacterium]|nr:hypothetical protein [Frankiales bacterium]